MKNRRTNSITRTMKVITMRKAVLEDGMGDSEKVWVGAMLPRLWGPSIAVALLPIRRGSREPQRSATPPGWESVAGWVGRYPLESEDGWRWCVGGSTSH